MKWICVGCKAINPQFGTKCHNCGRPSHDPTLPNFYCKKCKNEVNPKYLASNKILLTCCGITEKYGRNVKRKVKLDMERKDALGRLHGSQPTFGSGEISYRHGVLNYLDDGNGNVYDGDLYPGDLEDYSD